VIDAYKSHLLFVNVNSVIDSPTMFSRRVFELIACGTAVVTTESVGIAEMFGDIVPIVESEDEGRDVIGRLLTDHAHRGELIRRGRRLVLSQHTYRERLATIARTVGYPASTADDGGFSAVVPINDASALDRLAEIVASQQRRPDEIIVGVPTDALAEHAVQRLAGSGGDITIRTIVQTAGSAEHDERMRELAALATRPWLAPLDVQAEYDPHHFEDLSISTTFADADVVGSPTTVAAANRYVSELHPTSALVRRDVLTKVGWPSASADLAPLFWRGLRLYAGDADSFEPRNSADPNSVRLDEHRSITPSLRARRR